MTQPSFASHLLLRVADSQSAWALALCLLLLVATLWLAYHGYRRLSGRHAQALEEGRSAREHAAHELGDSLLQDFQALVFRFQTAIELVEPGPARQMLEEAAAASEQVLAEGRKRALSLSASLAGTDDFADSLVGACGDLQKQTPTRYRVIVHGKIRALCDLRRDVIYQIGREALTNAFTHSYGSRIEAEIFYNPSGLLCCFRDNGRGIDEESLSASRGFSRMREKAESIGAKLDIWSRANAGTELAIRVPSELAYRVVPAKRPCMLYRFIVNREE